VVAVAAVAVVADGADDAGTKVEATRLQEQRYSYSHLRHARMRPPIAGRRRHG